MTQEAIHLLGKALNMAPQEIGPDTRLGLVPQWDSLAHMRLILAIEARLGRQLDPREILSIDSPGALADILRQEHHTGPS